MQIEKQYAKKKLFPTIAVLLIISMAIPMITLPTAIAHDPAWEIPTYAYINVSPTPIGVGQQATIVVWLGDTISGTSEVNSIRFHDYKLTITKPDGATETVTWDVVWDTTSSAYTLYTPDQVGMYTLNFSFPGQVYTWTGAYQNDTYLPSSSKTTLTVQEEPRSQIAPNPLPTEYWTRPIEGQNTNWYAVSSQWLGTGSPQLVDGKFRSIEDGVGPDTSHIMWSKPIQNGGVVGGSNVGVEGNMFYTGLTYNRRMGNPIIMYSRLYYQEPLGLTGTGGPTVCVDLRTGEELWRRTDLPSLSFGYYYDADLPNQHGVFYEGLLFTANFARAFDARSGNPLFNVTNVPTGAAFLGSKGEHLRYVIANAGTTANPNWRLLQWNSSKLWNMPTNLATPTISATTDGGTADRYDWNVSIPWRTGMTSASVVGAILGDVLLGYNGTLPSMTSQTPYTMWAISLKESSKGQLLWMKTYSPPEGNVTRSFATKTIDVVNRVFIAYDKDTMKFTGFSLDNGNQLWTINHPENASDFDFYNYLGSIGFNTAYGKLYYSGFGGVLYCYDTANGRLLWTYGNGGEGNSTNSGLETAWGNYPIFITTIADGNVYLETGEHSPNTPLYKGAKARCVDAETGEEKWTLLSWGGHHRREGYAVADGYYVYTNHYDMQIYSIGKGPSTTTVQAPLTQITAGESAIVQGTVIDIAAGTTKDEQAARFPNGVACVSDESMGEWMEYVYMQKSKPTTATGVEVTISAVDPNGNYIVLGTTRSDTSGLYSLAWQTPNVSGKYTITATFEGTEGYYGSYAQTAVVVSEPAATATPQPTPQLTAVDLYFVPAVIGIILAIVVVGIVIVLVLKKRP
jgi:outer membrane protein assembly factor BamB